MEEKIHLVEMHQATYGLNACCQALGLPKSTLHYRRNQIAPEQRDADLKAEVASIIQRYPEYGYRRIQEEFEAQTGRQINHKHLRKLLAYYDLQLPRALPKGTPNPVVALVGTAGSSVNLVKGRCLDPLQAFTTDFTELVYAQGQAKAWLMVLLDISSKWVGGFGVDPSRNRKLAFSCLDQLCKHLSEWGMDLKGVIIHHDLDSVYTSHDWLSRLLLKEQVRVSFAEHGARDNPWMESFWGRFKTENHTLIRKAQALEELTRVVEQQLIY